jgi:restriction endonuclease
VAIREGVLKTLQITRDHFRGLYPDVQYRFFAWERARIDRLVPFVRSTSVDFMVLTIDAFNKASNVLRQEQDRFGGAAPLQVLAACRPVLVLDEPQHLDSPLSRASLACLQPLFALRFGATLGRADANIVHRLTPAQAHARGLVKTIEVVPCDVPGPLPARFSAQIRATIAAHLQRQRALRSRGIKVLSLFFLDRVARYTDDDDALVRRLFDQHFEALAGDDPGFAGRPAASVRAAYFATARRRCVDSTTGRSAADGAAYELIMRDKERLLSLDEPVAFIFSHSALREGWDNPNVFQICTLAQSVSAVKKRQEIGRGIRLCVDAHGRRVLDRDVNVLQVFANASYEDYVAGLQREDEPALPPSDRAPLPRGAGQGRAPAAQVEAPATLSWPRTVDVAPLSAAVTTALQSLPAAPVCPAADEAQLLDLLELELHAHDPACPLSRATLVAILRDCTALPEALADPPAAAAIVASTLRSTLAAVGSDAG